MHTEIESFLRGSERTKVRFGELFGRTSTVRFGSSDRTFFTLHSRLENEPIS